MENLEIKIVGLLTPSNLEQMRADLAHIWDAAGLAGWHSRPPRVFVPEGEETAEVSRTSRIADDFLAGVRNAVTAPDMTKRYTVYMQNDAKGMFVELEARP